MVRNWQLKNFRIDPLINGRFMKKCGAAGQQDVFNELIRMFVDDEIQVNVKGTTLNTVKSKSGIIIQGAQSE